MKKHILNLLRHCFILACMIGLALQADAANVTTYYRAVDGTFSNGSIVSPSSKFMSVGESGAFSATAPKGTRAGEWWVYTASPLGATAASASPKRKVGEGARVTYTMQADDLYGSEAALVLYLVKTYAVKANVSPDAAGSVTISGTNVVGTVDEGGKVTLTATAKSGYAFDHWEGSATGDKNQVEISGVSEAISCTAFFRELVIAKPSVTTSFTYDGKEKVCATAGDHYTVSGNAQTGAGTYTFTATLKDGYHWTGGSTDPYTVEWAISKASNTFTATPTIAGWTYGSSASTPTATAKFSGTSGITYSYYDSSKKALDGNPSNAGTYYLKATTPATDNYTSVTSDFVKFVIAPKEINTDNISFEDKTETYDGTSKKIVVSYFPDTVTVSYEGNMRTEAGSQTATVNFSPKDANYTVSTQSKTATLTIEQATVSSLALVASSVTYDGQPHPPVVKSVTTANGKTFTDATVGWTVTYDREDFVNAGEIKVSVTGNNNLTGSAHYPQTFTINRARTAELSATPTALTYNGQPQGPGLTLTHCAEDAASEHEKTDVGTYYVRATPTANYAWSDGTTTSRSIPWTISYLKVTVSFDLNYEGASAPSTSELNYMKGYVFSFTPSRTGYDFKGWWTAKEGGTEVTTSTKVESSSAHTLYAHWEAKKYAVTLNRNGGDCADLTSYTYGVGATLPKATKTGYTFDGWYESQSFAGNPVTAISASDYGAKTFYAKFTGNYYEVGYDNIFSMTDWIRSKSGRTANASRTDVECDVKDGTIKLVSKDNLDANQYTYYSRTSLANSGVYASWCDSGTDLQIRFSVSFSNARLNALTLWTFYYDADGEFLPDTGYAHAYSFSGSGAKEAVVTSPANAKYISVFFCCSIGTVGGSMTISDFSIRRGRSDFGIEEPARKAYQYSGGKLGELAVPKRTGYTFAGWRTEDDGAGSEVTRDTDQFTASRILHSAWTANAYTVTFSGNGGTATPTSKSVTYDSTYGELAACTRTGYAFDGWWTAASGGTQVKSSTQVTNAAHQTLYAHWTANSYTVKFDANGGGGTMEDQPFTYDAAQDLWPNAFTRPGYVFNGWNTKANGLGTSYTDERNVMNLASDPNAVVTLYAQWKHGIYTVTFDANGGTTSTATRDVTHGSAYGTLPTPTRKGYDFGGWWTGKKDGVQVIGTTVAQLTAAQTLYARWTAKTYRVTINLKDGETYEDATGKHTNSKYKLPETLVFDATNLNQIAVAVKADDSIFQGYKLNDGTFVYDKDGKNLKWDGAYWTADYPNGIFCHDGDIELIPDFAAPLPHYNIDVSVSPAEAGTAEGAGTYVEGSNVVLSAKVTNPGYSFAYWNRTNDNVHVSTDKTYSFTVSASAGYEAVFTGNVYTVTFRETGEKEPPTKNVTFGQAYGDFPQLEEDPDYELEWRTESDGHGQKVDPSMKVTAAEDHDIYAYWKERENFDVIYIDSWGETTGNKTFTNQVKRTETPEITEEIAKARTENVGRWTWTAPDGRIFNGWDPSLPQPVVHGLTLTAQWESLADVLDYTGSEVSFAVDLVGFWKVQKKEKEGDTAKGDSCLRLEGAGGGNNTVTASLKKSGKLSFHWKASADNVLTVKIGNQSDKIALTGSADMGWTETNVTVEVDNPSGTKVVFECANSEPDAFCALDFFALKENVPEYHVTVASGEHGSASCDKAGPFHAGDSVTLTATEAPGYAFCCWTNETGVVTNVNPWTFTVETNVSYTATFTNAQYVVTLDPNGGTGGQTEVLVTYDKPLPALTSFPERTGGWKFGGYTNADGVAYYDVEGKSAKDWGLPNAATLYAQWNELDKYTLNVTVEPKDRGSVLKTPDEGPYVANTQVQLEAKPDIGAAFKQWSDGVESPTRTVTMTSDITLTATFTNCQYVVTLNPNGGSVSPTTKIVTYGGTYGELPTPTQNGYTFKGWFTRASGGNKVETTTAVTTDADKQELFAQWDQEVGELSKALDCSNLDFTASGGWAVFTNETFAKEGISCLSNSVAGAELSTTVTATGTLTFWWRGRGGDDFVRMKVSTNSVEIKSLEMQVSADDSSEWATLSLDITASSGNPVAVLFKADENRYDGDMALDFVTWTPDAPVHPEPTDADKATISAVSVKDGKFTLSFTSDERFDYNLLTNANLLIDSWGKMEKKVGTGETLTFEPEIIDGLPQLFYKVETIQRQD